MLSPLARRCGARGAEAEAEPEPAAAAAQGGDEGEEGTADAADDASLSAEDVAELQAKCEVSPQPPQRNANLPSLEDRQNNSLQAMSSDRGQKLAAHTD